MPVQSWEEIGNSLLRVMVYGPSGAGKTHLLATSVYLPELSPILYCDIDGSKETLQKIPPELRKNITVLKMLTQKDIAIMEAVLFGTRKNAFKTVVLDSLNEYWALLMKLHLEASGRSAQGRVNPSQPDYGTILNEMLAFVRRIRDEGKAHFLCAVSEAIEKDEITGGLERAPGMVGKLASQLPPLFQISGRVTMEVVTDLRGGMKEFHTRLQLLPFDRVAAKSRQVGELVPFLIDPTMKEVYNLLHEEGVSAATKSELAEPAETEQPVETEENQ